MNPEQATMYRKDIVLAREKDEGLSDAGECMGYDSTLYCVRSSLVFRAYAGAVLRVHDMVNHNITIVSGGASGCTAGAQIIAALSLAGAPLTGFLEEHQVTHITFPAKRATGTTHRGQDIKYHSGRMYDDSYVLMVDDFMACGNTMRSLSTFVKPTWRILGMVLHHGSEIDVGDVSIPSLNVSYEDAQRYDSEVKKGWKNETHPPRG